MFVCLMHVVAAKFLCCSVLFKIPVLIIYYLYRYSYIKKIVGILNRITNMTVLSSKLKLTKKYYFE